MKEDILQKIESLYDLDKHQEIIELIEALPAEQLNAEIVSELGRAYNNNGEYEKGLEVLKGIEFEEGNTPSWNWRIAYSYYFLDDFINAEKHLLKSIELNPEEEFTYTLLIETYIALSRVEDENGNYEKAVEYALEAKKYVRDEEGEANADSFLAWLYDRYGHYVEAEEILKNLINKTKNDEWLYSELGFCLAEQGRQEEALESYFKSMELGREDAWIFTRIAISYKNMDKKEEALEYYLKAFELREDDIFLMSDIAWLYDSLGEFEKALKYLERLEELGQDDAWTNTEYGYCLSKLRRYEEAIVKINRALEIEDDEKDTAYIYSQLGWCQRHLEKYDEAIEAFSQAKKWARNDAWINIEIGHCYKAKNEREKALDFYLKAEKFD